MAVLAYNTLDKFKDKNMDRKGWAILAFIIIIILAVGIYLFIKSGTKLPAFLSGINTLIEGSPTPTPTLPEVYGDLFESYYLHLTVPEGWNIVTKNLGSVPDNFATEYYEIEKDGYIIYINPSTGPADGSEGGKFSDIAQHIAGSSLVIEMQPSNPCEDNMPQTKMTTYMLRSDFYVSKDNTVDWCNKPSNGTIWYGSYVSSPGTGYFGEVYMINKKPEIRRYLITMGYSKAKNINDLPKKDSKELNAKLLEMSAIVRSIVFK
jgi:hypothetical protein